MKQSAWVIDTGTEVCTHLLHTMPCGSRFIWHRILVHTLSAFSW